MFRLNCSHWRAGRQSIPVVSSGIFGLGLDRFLEDNAVVIHHYKVRCAPREISSSPPKLYSGFYLKIVHRFAYQAKTYVGLMS